VRALENKRWSGRFVMNVRSTHIFPVLWLIHRQSTQSSMVRFQT
jgi:hypothetical protein